MPNLASVALAFGALMYKMLISRPNRAAAVGAFATSLLGTDIGIAHGGVMQVLHTYLQDVCGTSDGVWIYMGVGQPDAHDYQQPVDVG